MALKAATDVANPPAGWKPDMTFIKRQIHFTEPPNETQYPYARIVVEQNMVDLDPGDTGTLTSDINLEVRVDNAGMLNVGPIALDVDLDSPKQIVEVTFQAQGNQADGSARAPVKFEWNATNQTEPRYWMMFTGQKDYIPRYKYQVRVIVKGSIFTKGMQWTGPLGRCRGEWSDYGHRAHRGGCRRHHHARLRASGRPRHELAAAAASVLGQFLSAAPRQVCIGAVCDPHHRRLFGVDARQHALDP
jgi:hypothetical protein